MAEKETIRQRIYQRIFRSEIEEMQRMAGIFESAYERGRAILPPDVLMRQLQENGQLTDLIMRLRGELIGLGFTFSIQDRDRAIEAARYYAATDVSVARARAMWVDWGMGARVGVTSDNPVADKLLKEFWNAKRNSYVLSSTRIHEQVGYRSLDEGEIAFACWWSPVDKKVTVQILPTDMLTVIWRDENLKDIPLFYKYSPSPTSDIYFPDWRASKQELEAAAIPDGANRTDQPNEVTGSIQLGGTEAAATLGNMIWEARNIVNEIGRGMPQFSNGIEWAKVLNQFMGDRAAVARKAAMYTETVTIDAGSRGVSDFKDRLESGLVSGNRRTDNNPPPAAASDWIQNQAVAREWQSRDTGATSARFDARMIAGMLGQNTGLPLHWAGFPDAIPGGLATARELLKPWEQSIQRYQLWLSSVFEALCSNVLAINGSDSDAIEIVINMETPLDINLQFLSQMITSTREAFTAGMIAEETAQELTKQLYILALDEFGIRNPSEVVEMIPATEYGKLESVARAIMQRAEERGHVKPEEIALLVTELLDG